MTFYWNNIAIVKLVKSIPLASELQLMPSHKAQQSPTVAAALNVRICFLHEILQFIFIVENTTLRQAPFN